MGEEFMLALHLLTLTRMKKAITTNVGGTFIAGPQHCGQDLHMTTDTQEKSMDQGKKMNNMFTKETVWEL